MEWFEKFKVGEEVRVVKKIHSWNFGSPGTGATWVGSMDKTIGKVHKILQIDTRYGYQLDTFSRQLWDCNYWFPVEALQLPVLVGEQLEFNFMKE